MKRLVFILLVMVGIFSIQAVSIGEDLQALAGLFNALGTLSDDDASAADQFHALGDMYDYLSGLDEHDEETNSFAKEPQVVRIVSNKTVNVRSAPNTDSVVVGKVDSGKEYEYLGTAPNGWLNIKLPDGTVGYVSGKMGEVVGRTIDSNPVEINSETVSVKLSSGRIVNIRKTVKDGLDAYEQFMDKYKEAMSSIGKGDLKSYTDFMAEYEKYMETIDKMEGDLTDDESLYYLEVSTRVLEKMY